MATTLHESLPPLAILLQPSCTSHKWIRTNNSSHIFERPERIRAVMLGVCAGVAMKEKEQEVGNQAGKSSEDRLQGGEVAQSQVHASESRDRSAREATPDLANLLGGLSLAPDFGKTLSTTASHDKDLSRPSRYIYIPPVAFSPSPLPYDLIPTVPSINTATDPTGTSSPTRARMAATVPPAPTLKNHPRQPSVTIPTRPTSISGSGESETITPGSLLLNHPASQIVHSSGPPDIPIPFIPRSSHLASTTNLSGSRPKEITRSSYLPRLLHWSLRAPALIKRGKCEIPKFYDDDDEVVNVAGGESSTIGYGHELSSTVQSTIDTTGPAPDTLLGAASASSRKPPHNQTQPRPQSRSQPLAKDAHGRSPTDEGYGQGEETGFNQGDLYLGPGSVGAIEGCIRTVCQAVDLICGAQPVDVPGKVDETKAGDGGAPVVGEAESSTSGGIFGSALTTPPEQVNRSAGHGAMSHDTTPAEQRPPHCKHAFCIIRPPGHHCGQDTPSGFCYVNNVAIGAMHAYIAHDYDRAIILDFDLHHGNGTQSIVMGLNEATHTEELQLIAGKPPPVETEREARLGRRRRGWKGFYGSLHDIWSYPCEDGDLDLIRDASVSLAGHGQHIENIHLEPYESEADFYERLYPRYLVLLERAQAFLKATEAGAERAVVFISAGFDACQFEHQTMQRHDRRVPASFFDRFTRDIAAFADKNVNGKIISVLEGGYSDRALASGAASHVSGFLSPVVADRGHWWNERAMQNLEKATKKRRTGGLMPMSAESSAVKEFRRTHELLGILEAWGVSDGPTPLAASAPPERRVGLRDRRKPLADDASPVPPQKRATGRIPKAKSANTTPVHQITTPHKVPATEGRPIRRDVSREDDDSGLETPTHHATNAKALIGTPTTDFQKALDKMSSMSMHEDKPSGGRGAQTLLAGTSPSVSLNGSEERGQHPIAGSQEGNRGASTMIEQDEIFGEQPRHLPGSGRTEHPHAESEDQDVTPEQSSPGNLSHPKDVAAHNGKILLKFKLPATE